WADQRNWALRNPDICARWILFLDADEQVTDALRDSVASALACNEHAGWYVNRRLWFLGRPLRHGGLSPNWALRMVRRDVAHWERDGMREFAVVDGSVGRLDGYVEHQDQRGVLFWTAKHAWLAGLEAVRADELEGNRSHHQEARSRRVIRRRLLARLPPSIPAF